MDALEQLLAAPGQRRAHEALDERLLVGERIGEPVAGRAARLLEGGELARENPLRAERDFDVLEHLGDVEDCRHARREGEHLEALEAFEQGAPGDLARARDPDVEHLDLGAARERQRRACPGLAADVEQILHTALPVPAASPEITAASRSRANPTGARGAAIASPDAKRRRAAAALCCARRRAPGAAVCGDVPEGLARAFGRIAIE
jgi:hypothetical protein